MAEQAYSPTRTTDLNGLWRKVQLPLRVALNTMFEEWDALSEFTKFDADWSTREITAPIDVYDETGIASIEEGDYEAEPTSVGVVDASFSWVMYNGRFTVTKTAKMIDQRSKSAMLVNQFKFQGKKKIQAIKRRVADDFYGTSSGIKALVSAVVSGDNTLTQVLELKNGYNQADIQDGGYIANLFRVKERVAFVRAGALLGIARITSVTTVAGVARIGLTFAAAVDVNVNDAIVFANSMGNTTLAHTDYNKAMSGWLDCLKANSLQGIDRTVVENWKIGYANEAAGRFTNVSYRRLKQAIENRGGKLTDLLLDQQVENDMYDQMQAGLRFSDAFNLELDGQVKARGVKITSPRRMLPGYAIGYDRKARAKMVLLPDPTEPGWEDGDKIPDKHAFVFSLDYPCQSVTVNPGAIAYESNKQRQ
ncbi:MAG: hypothetical protein IT355_12055 [Gemmatimonadaceae bacterium]|nr:hypothetical protein [Gemmatimonadaceae bacterium]